MLDKMPRDMVIAATKKKHLIGRMIQPEEVMCMLFVFLGHGSRIHSFSSCHICVVVARHTLENCKTDTAAGTRTLAAHAYLL